MTTTQKIFSFDGRLRRRDYWLISIGIGVFVMIVTEILMLTIFGPSYSVFGQGPNAYMVRSESLEAFTLQTALSLLTFWPALAISAKRAHDRNHSARLVVSLTVLVFFLSYAPTFFWMFYPGNPNEPGLVIVSLGVSLLSLIASIYLLVVVGFLDGTPGINRYGPSPKHPDSDVEVFN